MPSAPSPPADSFTKRRKTHRNKTRSGLAAGNNQPIARKGVAAGGQSRVRRCVIGTCSRRHWPDTGCVAVGGVSGSQRCHSKPGEPGRALQLGERLARRQAGALQREDARRRGVGNNREKKK